MRYLKQSTSVDVAIGPFLDETDGKTAETALTITQPDVRLKKNNGNWAQKNAAQTLSHEENGFYEVTLDATDTATLGLLRLAVNEAGALPVWEDFVVLAANVYDALIGGGDLLQVDTARLSGDATAADNLETMLDGTGGQTLSLGRLAITRAEGPALDIGVTTGVAAKIQTADTAGMLAAIEVLSGSTGIYVEGEYGLILAGGAAALELEGMVRNTHGEPLRLSEIVIHSKEVGDAELYSLTDHIAAIKTRADAIEVDTQDLQARVPAALVGGRIDASVGAMQADTISSSALSAAAVDEILDEVIEGSVTLRQALRLVIAALGGKLSGAATSTITIRDLGDAKNRITATVDGDGNRTAVTLDLS